MSEYIPGHEHYAGHNNWKRDMLYGCGDGSDYDRKPNSLDDGFYINNRTTINLFGFGTSKNSCHSGGGFFDSVLKGLNSSFGFGDCCGGNSLGRFTGGLLGTIAKAKIFSLFSKNNYYTFLDTYNNGGAYSFINTGWVGGGNSSIFGGGYNSGYTGGDFLVNSTGLAPWSPVVGGNNGNSTQGTGNNSNASAQGNDSNTPSTPSTPGSGNGNVGSGNGTVISANDFNNAIDDLASDGKTTELYYGVAQNTNETMKGYLEKTESKHGNGVDEATQKRGIRAGKANEAAGKETKDKQDGYYKYITLTDGISNNEYTYTFVSAKDGKLTYKLSKNDSDTSKDGKGTGWELTDSNMPEPTVVIRIKDGVIYLESAGTDYSATKKGEKKS